MQGKAGGWGGDRDGLGRPVHCGGGLKHLSGARIRHPDLTARCGDQNAVGVRHAVVAECMDHGVSPGFAGQVPEDQVAVQDTEVPALWRGAPHGLQQRLVITGEVLLCPVPILIRGAFRQQVQVIGLLRRMLHSDGQQGLGAGVRQSGRRQNGKGQQQKCGYPKPAGHRNHSLSQAFCPYRRKNRRRYSSPNSCFQVSTRRQAVSMVSSDSVPPSTASITLGIWVR